MKYITFIIEKQKIKDMSNLIMEIPHPLEGKVFKVLSNKNNVALLEYVPRANESQEPQRFLKDLQEHPFEEVDESVVPLLKESTNYSALEAFAPKPLSFAELNELFGELDAEGQQD
jgi:hypothetical protein